MMGFYCSESSGSCIYKAAFSQLWRGACCSSVRFDYCYNPSPTRPTLMRSIPASILSCSTSFLAWAILLVVDILIHQTGATQEKTAREQDKTEWIPCFCFCFGYERLFGSIHGRWTLGCDACLHRRRICKLSGMAVKCENHHHPSSRGCGNVWTNTQSCNRQYQATLRLKF